MVDLIKYASISRIYIKDLRFYQPEKKSECLSFCKNLGISYLPDVSRKFYYEIVNDDFIKRKLNAEASCNPTDLLFSRATLQKFERNPDNVLFVVENGIIKGVIHIVDYNNEFLFFEFYKLVFHFERNLRRFLVAKKETQGTLLKWVNDNNFRNSPPLPKTEELKAFPLFDAFYLSLLVSFVTSSETKYFNWNYKKNIGLIRNWVAHNRDVIATDKNDDSERSLYDFKGLTRFVEAAIAFFDYFEELEQKLLESGSN